MLYNRYFYQILKTIDLVVVLVYYKAMETIECIASRHSCRNFLKNKKVEKELVLDILKAGALAPSAKNRQPWKFAVATEEQKESIVKLMCRKVDEEDLKAFERKSWNTGSSVKSTARAISEADFLILVFKYKDINWNISDNLSIGACVENMCLRATSLGLGSLWIRDTYAVENEICAMMKSKNLELVCSLAIGYPKNLAFTQKHRNKFKDNFVQFKKAEFNLYQNNLCLLESENKPNLQK